MTKRISTQIKKYSVNYFMKEFYPLFLIATFCSFTGRAFGQRPIRYGSNNGKYAIIYNKKFTMKNMEMEPH